MAGRGLCHPEPASHEMLRSILVSSTDFSCDLEEQSHKPQCSSAGICLCI